jgi:diguanylate cyclase (GGDEF)-like protein/PAS domain S-box-containing protein
MGNSSLILEQIRQNVELLLAGEANHISPLSPELTDSSEERAFISTFNIFLKKYQEAMNFVDDVCKGQLETEPPARNQLIASFKQLHSQLRTLVWQTQRLAAGDLNQQVDFMGDFSTAFNTLIQSLREKQALQEELFRSEEFYKALVHISPYGITVISLDGVQKFVSETGLKMFGFDELAELVGKKYIERITPESIEDSAQKIAEVLSGKQSGVNEYQAVRKDGSLFWIEANAEVLRNPEGEPEGLMLVYRDISEKKILEQQAQEYTRLMTHQAQTDRMTGLLNRVEGLVVLDKELKRCEKNQTSLAVCYIDIDGLKTVNDHYGHMEGDRMIMTMASTFPTCVRNTDHVCRIGGDEFLIIFPECDLKIAELVVNRMKTSMDRQNAEGKYDFHLSFSHGIVVANPGENISADQLVMQSDEKMYIQKREKKIRQGNFLE